MNDLVDLTSSAAAPAARAVLHWGFSDPKSPMLLPVALPSPLRVALIAQLAARGGTLVEGEQGLSSFHRSAVQAVLAAIEILGAGTSLLVDEIAPVAMRAVLVDLKDGGETGRAEAIRRATEVIRLSRDHTLLMTREIYEQLDRALSERVRLAVAPVWVDSHPELANLFEMDWRQPAVKPVAVTGAARAEGHHASAECLELTHGGTQLSLSAEDCPVTLGRDKSCRVHLGGDAASRMHGRIDYVHDKFYFIDDSRNGTYLLTPQGEEVFLRGERLPLLGRGVISPGAPIVKQTGEVLRYTCRSQTGPHAWMAALAQPGDAETKFTH